MDAIVYLCETIAGAALALAVVLSIGNKVKAKKAAKKAPPPPPPPRQAETAHTSQKTYCPDIEEKPLDSSWKNAAIFFLLLIIIILLVILSQKP